MSTTYSRDTVVRVAALAAHRLLPLMPHAVEYLKNVRGVDDTTAARWKLGYWDQQWCTDLLARNGISEQHLQTAGVTAGLQGRVLIPVTDPVGKPIGFIGRAIPPNQTGIRYLYATHELARRRYNLFGLPFALKHIPQYKFIILVEGPLDAILLEQVGYPAVCTHGAYLTIEQALLLRAFQVPIYALGDGDDTGKSFIESVKRRKAYLPSDRVLAITCPKGFDPAKIIQMNAASEIPRLLFRSAPL